MRLHVPTPLRWSDLDAYGHVNNARMLSLLEEARIQAFWVNDDGTAEHAVGASTAVLDATPGSATTPARSTTCARTSSAAMWPPASRSYRSARSAAAS